MPKTTVTPPGRVPSRLVMLMALACLGGVSTGVQAHHAFSAEFDADRPIDLKGVVTKIKWVNPHSWLYFDVTGKDGTVTNWGVEFGTPNALASKGLTKDSVAPGTAVQIKGYLAKNGGAFGYAAVLTLPDGRVVQTGGAQDSPTPAPAAR